MRGLALNRAQRCDAARCGRTGLVVLATLGMLACGPEVDIPGDERIEDNRCHGFDSRPDVPEGLRVTFCTDDNAQFSCYRLFPRPSECPDGQVVVACYRPEDEARTMECGAPLHCMPGFVDNPPCCPAEVTEPLNCAP